MSFLAGLDGCCQPCEVVGQSSSSSFLALLQRSSLTKRERERGSGWDDQTRKEGDVKEYRDDIWTLKYQIRHEVDQKQRPKLVTETSYRN